eukprot:s1083_g4.t1
MQLRGALKEKWIDVAGDLHWQAVFVATSPDGDVERHLSQDAPDTSNKCKQESSFTPPNTPIKCKTEISLITPPKRRKRSECVDLCTPPSAPPKEKKMKLPARIGNSQPAQVAQPHKPDDSMLKVPQKKRQRADFMEPAAADMEEKFSQLMMAIPGEKIASNAAGEKKASEVAQKPSDPVEELDITEIDEQALAEVNEELLMISPARMRKAAFTRSCKKKLKTTSQLQAERLRVYLCKKGLSYGGFMKGHKRCAMVAKAAVCNGGGYASLQLFLRGTKPIAAAKCRACIQLLSERGITKESIEAVLKGETEPEDQNQIVEAKSCEQSQIPPPPPPPPEQKPPVPEIPPGMTEIEAIREYVAKFNPIIELVEEDNRKGYSIAYTCRVCMTRGQPRGKLNTLGKRQLKYVVHYLHQHIISPTHQGNLAMLAGEQPAEEASLPKAECPGLLVGTTDLGTLFHYMVEFELWATHTNFTARVSQHSIWKDFSANQWYARHGNCTKQMIDGQICCKLCGTLAEPRSLQRKVLNFAMKYFAARLLNCKLFCREEDVKELLESWKDSALAERHGKFWKKLTVQLSCIELQRFVRNGFHHVAPENQTQNLTDFISTVVAPCLRVNATSISYRLPALSHQFSNALVSRDITELESLNLAVAEFAVQGRLEENPFLQGLLVNCMRQIERQEKGLGPTGRGKAQTETERSLARDSAITLSMLSGNKQLAQKLGQSQKGVKVGVEDLEAHGFPNPMLALMCQEQLESNVELCDQLFPRGPDAPVRRLVLAFDHTYLLKTLCQATWKSEAGLVGGCWSPFEPDGGFMPLASLPADSVKKPKANLMLECLCWDPAARKQFTCSLASMPMRLRAANADPQTEMLATVGKVMKAAAAIIKGIAFDAHCSHSWIRDALMGQFESLRPKDLEGAPMLHKSMPLAIRTENAMCGFVLMDLWKLMADRLASQRGLQRGTLWLANQSMRNIQSIALSLITVALSKHPIGNFWSHGHVRLGEVAIEEHFGRLRAQSSSANLTARSYWKAACREVLSKASKGRETDFMTEKVEPLGEEAFEIASVKAYRAAIKLVAHICGVTEDSLRALYEDACEGAAFAGVPEPLHPFEEDGDVTLDGTQGGGAVADTKAEPGVKEVLQNIPAEAALDQDLPDATNLEHNAAENEWKDMPDFEELKAVTETVAEGESGACEGDPRTLGDVVSGLHAKSEDGPLWDKLWRLTMFLRHWKLIQIWNMRGHVLIFITNLKNPSGQKVQTACVGLVLTLWKCAKKPKLATASVEMKHMVAGRVVLLSFEKEQDGLVFRADGTSISTIIKPMSVVSILDCTETQESQNGVMLKLTPESEALLENLHQIPTWFPPPDEGAEVSFSNLGGVPRVVRRRRRRPNPKSAKSGPRPLTEKKKRPRKSKKGRKKLPPALSKISSASDAAFAPQNFRKNNVGRQLIRSTLSKLREKDLEKFPQSPLFEKRNRDLQDEGC